MSLSRRHILLVLVVTRFAIGTSVAQEVSPLAPPQQSDAITAPATLRLRPATRLILGTFAVRLEETTLSRVRAETQTGVIAHQGDAGASEYWLCYMVPARGRSADQLWIVSSEMGGMDHVITEVIAVRIGSDQAATTMRCPALPRRFRTLSLDRGIWLGLTRQRLIQALGEPSGTRGDWLVFHYLGRATRPKAKALTGDEHVAFTETNLLEVQVVHGSVIALRAAKITTN